MKKRKTKFICGVDEVGRGPIAGPVTVGLVMYERKHERLFKDIPLRDSKKLSPQKRRLIYSQMKVWKKEGRVFFTTASVSAKKIDGIGIAQAIRDCIAKVFHKIEHLEVEPLTISVKLDGGLYAPEQFVYQETIVRGDAKERSIALASIVAKVTRDSYMERQSEFYPEYGFEQHKGYGTKDHYKALKKHGKTRLHRQSFLNGLVG